MRASTERRAEENKKANVGDDLDKGAMMEAIGVIGFNESDLKYNEAVDKFINQLFEETFGEFYDAISGEVLDAQLCKKAREAEMQTFKKHGTEWTRRLSWRSVGGSLGRPL